LTPKGRRLFTAGMVFFVVSAYLFGRIVGKG